MITKLFPGLVAVIAVAVLVIIVLDRADEVWSSITNQVGGFYHGNTES